MYKLKTKFAISWSPHRKVLKVRKYIKNNIPKRTLLLFVFLRSFVHHVTTYLDCSLHTLVKGPYSSQGAIKKRRYGVPLKHHVDLDIHRHLFFASSPSRKKIVLWSNCCSLFIEFILLYSTFCNLWTSRRSGNGEGLGVDHGEWIM